MGPIGCTETSVRNYRYTLHKSRKIGDFGIIFDLRLFYLLQLCQKRNWGVKQGLGPELRDLLCLACGM